MEATGRPGFFSIAAVPSHLRYSAALAIAAIAFVVLVEEWKPTAMELGGTAIGLAGGRLLFARITSYLSKKEYDKVFKETRDYQKLPVGQKPTPGQSRANAEFWYTINDLLTCSAVVWAIIQITLGVLTCVEEIDTSKLAWGMFGCAIPTMISVPVYFISFLYRSAQNLIDESDIVRPNS